MPSTRPKRMKSGKSDFFAYLNKNTMAGKKSNPWLSHLKSFWSKNKGKMSYRQAMVAAKKTYTKKKAK